MTEQEMLNALKRIDEIKRERYALISPNPPRPRPPSFQGLDDANAYRDLLDAWRQQKDMYEDKARTLDNERTQLCMQLAENIPVGNSWIRIGDYAVAAFYSTWGGGHTEIRIVEWEDGLEPLPDQTYFS